jgi:hypothetical protein
MQASLRAGDQALRRNAIKAQSAPAGFIDKRSIIQEKTCLLEKNVCLKPSGYIKKKQDGAGCYVHV